MQKKLIALAVAGLVAAPAFAATSNVDVYGIMTLSVDKINTDVSGSDDPLRVSSNSSRIGFKGSEDLGGGLAGIWQIENQLNADNGTNNLVDALGAGSFSSGLRNTFIGLKGGFGTTLLGKHDTPYKLATGKLDVFGDSLGDYNNIIGNVNGSNNFDLRPGNVIAYITPTMGGLHGAIAYVAGQELSNGNGGDASAWSVMGMYDNGPIFASLAYEKHNNLGGAPSAAAVATVCRDFTVDGAPVAGDPNAGVGATYTPTSITGACSAGDLRTTTGVPAVAASSGTDRDAWKLGLGYNFGNAKVGLIYEDAETILGGSAEDRKAWYLNGAYTMGNVVLKAAYGRAGKISGTSDTGANTFTIGADYNLSKRTMAYAQYQKVNNNDNATYGLGAGQGSAYTPAAGADPSAFSVGMRHSF
jgi:predicted porin